MRFSIRDKTKTRGSEDFTTYNLLRDLLAFHLYDPILNEIDLKFETRNKTVTANPASLDREKQPEKKMVIRRYLISLLPYYY
jgi:hypothetical protein